MESSDLFGGTWPPSPTPNACARVLRALAPGGLGIIYVRGSSSSKAKAALSSSEDAPTATAEGCLSCARARLLHLAFELGALDPLARGAILSSAGVGRDGPRAAVLPLDLSISTFNPSYAPAAAAGCAGECAAGSAGGGAGRVRELMAGVGGALAGVCAAVAAAADKALDDEKGLTYPPSQLFSLLIAAQTAKARLVMYAPVGPQPSGDLWQPWHLDFGLFTAITPPAYLGRAGATVAPPQGAGLLVAAQGAVLSCVPPPDCIAVQVGEAAQLLSRGRLSATPHAVRSPLSGLDGDAARAVLVVFCLPPWSTLLPDGEGGAETGTRAAVLAASQRALDCLPTPDAVPSLSKRWLGGVGATAQTFTDFAKLTTAAYYGKKGTGGTQRDVKRA